MSVLIFIARCLDSHAHSRSFCLSQYWTQISLFVLLLISPSCTLAQEEAAYVKAANPYVVHEGSNIDSVDMTTGNLNVDIPLLSFPQRGPDLTLDFNIRYSGPQWYMDVDNIDWSSRLNGVGDACGGNKSLSGAWDFRNGFARTVLPTGMSVVHTQFMGGGFDSASREIFYNNSPNGNIGTFSLTGGGWTPVSQAYVDSVLPDSGDPKPPTLWGPASELFCSHTPANIQNQVLWVGDARGAKHYYGASSSGTGLRFQLPTTEDGSGISITTTGFVDRQGIHYDSSSTQTNPSRPTITTTDRFGNQIVNGLNASGQFGWTDTVGRFIPNQGLTVVSDGFSSGTLQTNQGTPTSDLSHCAANTISAFIWTVPAATSVGGTVDYYLCYSTVSYQTSFNIGQYSANNQSERFGASEANGSIRLLTQVVLPNGRSYSFAYDNYLCLASLTLPTGGTIHYSYANLWLYNSYSTQTHVYVPVISRVVTSRTVDALDGTGPHKWTYSWQTTPETDPLTASAPIFSGISAVVDPEQNAVLHHVIPQGGQDTEQQYYQGVTLDSVGFPTGGTLLKTVDTVYTQTGSGIFLSALGSNSLIHSAPSLITETMANGQQRAHQFRYVPGTGASIYYDFDDTLGWVKNGQYFNSLNPLSCACFLTEQLQSESFYDYGTGGSYGPLLKTITYGYMWQDSTKGASYQAANLIDLIASRTVVDSAGTAVASTRYVYDESSPQSSGLGSSQHLGVAPSSVLGQQTGQCDYLNPASTTACSSSPDAAYVRLSTSYYDSGEVSSRTDGRGNSTTFSYGLCQGSQPSLITNALGQNRTFGYDCNIGKTTTSVDANRAKITYTYNDSLGRLTEIDYPDSGSKQFGYNKDPIPPLLTITTATGGTAGPITENVSGDGLGRTLAVTLTSGPGSPISTTFGYDSVGRIASVSNAEQPGSVNATDGVTTYSYDGLGRKTLQCNPDNGTGSGTCASGISFKQWSYTGNQIKFIDERNDAWTDTNDGLGRLTKVNEPGGLNTTYSYNALNDVMCIDQWGGASVGNACKSSKSRSFTYDSLSRLLTSGNPETGIICYGQWSGSTCVNGYDANGNLRYKTDGRGITTSYGYDTLNRLISKTYPTDTPSSCHQYDVSPLVSGGGNLVGHLTNSWTQKGACPSPSSPPSFSGNKAILSRHSVLAYDATGRMQSDQLCTYSNCSTSKSYAPAYTYDLVGNVIGHSNGIGTTFTNCYDAAGHLSFVAVGSFTCGSTPSTSSLLFSSPTYSPAGGLTGATYGIGLQLQRTYDSRLRVTSETDTGNVVSNPTPGTATITISGTDHTQ